MKVAVMGTPVDSGNRGVLALGASLVNLCVQSRSDCEVILLLGASDKHPASFRVGGKMRSVSVVNYRMSPRSSPRDHLAWILAAAILFRMVPLRGFRLAIARSTPWIRAVDEADFVADVHGGDSFSDIYGLRGFFGSFLADWTVLLVKGSIVQLPQTYGPFKSPVARALARHLLRRSSVIIARDKASRELAQELAGPGRPVLLCADVAFSMESARPDPLVLDPPLTGPVPAGVVGINVNGLMYNGGYTRSNMFGLKMDYASLLPALVVRLLSEQPGEVWLVPHTFAPVGHVESDPEACQKVRVALPAELRPRVRIVDGEYDQHEIKGLIGMCDFFVGSRMHSCIAALSQGVPCVGIAYSMKFRGVFESVGMADWVVDGRDCGNDSAIERTLELFHSRQRVRPALAQASVDAKRQLVEMFSRLFSEKGKV